MLLNFSIGDEMNATSDGKCKKTSGSGSGNKKIFYVLDDEARRGETGRSMCMSYALCEQLENAMKIWIKDG